MVGPRSVLTGGVPLAAVVVAAIGWRVFAQRPATPAIPVSTASTADVPPHTESIVEPATPPRSTVEDTQLLEWQSATLDSKSNDSVGDGNFKRTCFRLKIREKRSVEDV
jgi:hypothetical protein